MNKKGFYFSLYTIATLVGVVLVLLTLFAKPYAFHGTLVEPPLPVGDFVLQTANNDSFRLRSNNEKITLLFFGYTSCPDVCPTTLAEFKQVYDILGDKSQKVRFVMITADPERDTATKLTEYVRFFNPAFIGLSGERAELEKVWKQFSIYVEKQDTTSAAGYMVSHTSSVFVLDQDNNLRLTFPYGTPANAIAEDLKELLQQSP